MTSDHVKKVDPRDGFYGLPSFEFLPVTAVNRQRSDDGLEYAHPSMMALANLLSHQDLEDHIMSAPVGGRAIHRASKDLGRVLALAWLEPREETERWKAQWLLALRGCFPQRWQELAVRLGHGLRALLKDANLFEEAWYCCAVGLLSGQNVSEDQLRATAERLLVDAIAPVEEAGLARG